MQVLCDLQGDFGLFNCQTPAPRHFLIVCADEDKYSKDAPQIFESVKEHYISKNAESNLYMKQYKGGHQLTQERFDYIFPSLTVENLKNRCKCPVNKACSDFFAFHGL